MRSSFLTLTEVQTKQLADIIDSNLVIITTTTTKKREKVQKDLLNNTTQSNPPQCRAVTIN